MDYTGYKSQPLDFITYRDGEKGTSVDSVATYYALWAPSDEAPEPLTPGDSGYIEDNPTWSLSPPLYTDSTNKEVYWEVQVTTYSSTREKEWGTPAKSTMLDVDFINSIGITAKKIMVTNKSNNIVFEAAGSLDDTPSTVFLSGGVAKTNRLEYNVPEVDKSTDPYGFDTDVGKFSHLSLGMPDLAHEDLSTIPKDPTLPSWIKYNYNSFESIYGGESNFTAIDIETKLPSKTGTWDLHRHLATKCAPYTCSVLKLQIKTFAGELWYRFLINGGSNNIIIGTGFNSSTILPSYPPENLSSDVTDDEAKKTWQTEFIDWWKAIKDSSGLLYGHTPESTTITDPATWGAIMLGDDLSEAIPKLIDSWVLVVCVNLGDLSTLDDDTKSFIEANKLSSGTNSSNSDTDEFHLLLPPQVLLETGHYWGASGNAFVESSSGATLITGDGKFYTNQLNVTGGSIGGLSISSRAIESVTGEEKFVDNIQQLAKNDTIAQYNYILGAEDPAYAMKDNGDGNDPREIGPNSIFVDEIDEISAELNSLDLPEWAERDLLKGYPLIIGYVEPGSTVHPTILQYVQDMSLDLPVDELNSVVSLVNVWRKLAYIDVTQGWEWNTAEYYLTSPILKRNYLGLSSTGIVSTAGEKEVTIANGTLFANNADISGAITANAGTIGGWTIDGTRLVANSNTAGLYPDSPTDILTFPTIRADNNSSWGPIEIDTTTLVTFPEIPQQSVSSVEQPSISTGADDNILTMPTYRASKSVSTSSTVDTRYKGCVINGIPVGTEYTIISSNAETGVDTVTTTRSAKFKDNTLTLQTSQVRITFKSGKVVLQADAEEAEASWLTAAYEATASSTHVLSNSVDTAKKIYINGSEADYIDKDRTWSFVDVGDNNNTATLKLDYDGNRTLTLTTTYESTEKIDYIPPTILVSNEPGDHSTGVIWAGSDRPGGAPFYVTNEGKLVAKNIDARGAIRATSGKVGDFSIAEDGGLVLDGEFELRGQPISNDPRMPIYKGLINSLRVRNLITGVDFDSSGTGVRFLEINDNTGLTIRYKPGDSMTPETTTTLSIAELEQLLRFVKELYETTTH